MIFKEPIVEVIKKRFSVRTYDNIKVSDQTLDQIDQFVSEIKGPFKSAVRFQAINTEELQGSTSQIGTYGVIKGAPIYIAAISDNNEYSLEQIGYTLEKIIVFLTTLGLGTCWLGGTFKRSGFEKLVDLKESEILPAVTPVGYIKNQKRVIDSTIRLLAGSNKRKQWDELFFEDNWETCLTKDRAGQYQIPLEMIRIAPSASNKQPWRVIKANNAWHFYLQPTKGYSKSLGFDIQRIDIGIAMCHFEMALIEEGLKGYWSIMKEVDSKEGAKYIISWIEEK